MNEFLFNGIWRIKVTSVMPTSGNYDVTMQLRNGSKRDFSMVQSTGFGGMNGGLINLVFSNDDTATMENAQQFVPYNNGIAFKHVPVGGFITGHLLFSAPQDASVKPVKLIVGYDPQTNVDKARYTVADPSFRVHLDCGT